MGDLGTLTYVRLVVALGSLDWNSLHVSPLHNSVLGILCAGRHPSRTADLPGEITDNHEHGEHEKESGGCEVDGAYQWQIHAPSIAGQAHVRSQPSQLQQRGVSPSRIMWPQPHALDIRFAAPFALLADPSRLRIVYTLVEGGPMCVSGIDATAGSGESDTSNQLAKLRAAGVVRSERRGREIWYQLADAHIRLLLDVAAEHYLSERPDSRA